ncbi:Biofilm operon icaADBC HTH-type negative transcriptional regulator IcaR [Candidatus Nitrosocosmicus oleophilus]|uniref:Biofilm operon icaADBC HTH-type negative transcriptional regulator IcaR n=2 Tax=Candidatus Nitrosocosmicus oleophilus TaxID=1353260 RepID=A0A654LV19_9ARCH|nr:Biofilm operon icaADBC HTH-type negative transcriptional regulator IcaR [Candidatus Nitrosocosmicus oleophilus]
MMMSRSKAKEEKSQLIINTALKVFSEKGYDNATIGDIAKSAKVSMGLPLYYFTNKEELACQALEFSSKQITHSILKDISGNSPEEIAASFINSFRKNIKIYPDFYPFYFEMWSASRRNKKIKKVFRTALDNTINATKIVLINAQEKGLLSIGLENIESIAISLVSKADGLGLLLEQYPQLIENENLWKSDKKMWMSVLENQIED